MKHLIFHSKHVVTQFLITFHTTSHPSPPYLFRIITRSLINVLIEICHNCFTCNCHKLVKLLVRIIVIIIIIIIRITITVIITITTLIIVITIIIIVSIVIIVIIQVTTIKIIIVISVIPIQMNNLVYSIKIRFFSQYSVNLELYIFYQYLLSILLIQTKHQDRSKIQLVTKTKIPNSKEDPNHAKLFSIMEE
ncbi:hypothetical protein ACB098_07G032700 [Castanea mollissima]